MKKHKGITLVELLVVITVAVSLLLIWWAARGRVHVTPYRVLCGTYLKGLGNAMTVYAYDYDGRFPQLPGTGPWAKELGFSYDMPKPDFSSGGAQADTPRTVTASWYLLVREADVGPKSFVCPHSYQKEFDGINSNNLDLVQLWDFGPTPHTHVSYSMHLPYGRFPGHDKLSSAFAVAADMSPWFKGGDIQPPGPNNTHPQILNLADPTSRYIGNTLNHPKLKTKNPEGQNVLFADGSTRYETGPNVGVGNDNIYTFWTTDENPTQQDIQGGAAPTGRTPENDAKSETDSFLVI